MFDSDFHFNIIKCCNFQLVCLSNLWQWLIREWLLNWINGMIGHCLLRQCLSSFPMISYSVFDFAVSSSDFGVVSSQCDGIVGHIVVNV